MKKKIKKKSVAKRTTKRTAKRTAKKATKKSAPRQRGASAKRTTPKGTPQVVWVDPAPTSPTPAPITEPTAPESISTPMGVPQDDPAFNELVKFNELKDTL